MSLHRTHGRASAMVTAPLHARKPYPSDLTDEEWAMIHADVPVAKAGGRPEERATREILHGSFYGRGSG